MTGADAAARTASGVTAIDRARRREMVSTPSNDACELPRLTLR
jgi:hypothetical protein